MERNAAELRRLADTLDALPDVYAGDEVNGVTIDARLDAIRAGLSGYNQASWGDKGDCGAYCCLAGWEMVNTYGDRVFHKRAGYDAMMTTFFYKDGSGPAFLCSIPDDETGDLVEDIRTHASRLLGLTDDEGYPLFSGGWRPAGYYEPIPGVSDHHAAAKALRALADGASIEDVSWEGDPDDEDEDEW